MFRMTDIRNPEELAFFPEIQKDIALYVDMLESLRQGDAQVLYDSPTALLLQLKSWPLYLIAAWDPEEGRELLSGMKQPNENGIIFMTLRGKALYDSAIELGFGESAPCYQVLYDKAKPIPLQTDLMIRHPDRSEYETICKTYTLPMPEDEVYASIDSPDFAAGYADGKLAGFIGLHPEGSMGMLHIFDEFRGRGYAYDLEAYIINGRLQAGAYPYGQVFTDNEASLSLQRKIGMTFSKDYICWMMKKEQSVNGIAFYLKTD